MALVHTKLSLLLLYVFAADQNHTDSKFLKCQNNQNRDAGSSAVFVGDRLLVTNVGVSRAVICRGGNGEPRYMTFTYYKLPAHVEHDPFWMKGQFST